MAEIVSRSHDLGETLENVVELVGRRLAADACSVYLCEPDLQHLTLRATRGLAPEAVGRIQLGFGEGLVGLAAERREPIAIEKAREHPRFRYFPETGEERFASLMAAPMLVQNVPIGVIVVQSIEPRRFGPEDIELLQTCAQLLAPVVLNATLLSSVGRPGEQGLRFVAELAKAGVRMAEGRPARRQGEHLELRGLPTSPGIAIGPVHVLEDPLADAHLDYEPSPDVEQEVEDLRGAIARARQDLEQVRTEVGEQFGPEFAAVFNTHIQILEDRGFLSRLEAAVRERGHALEAVQRVIDEYREIFGRLEDSYFRDRMLDVEDVGRRVVANLLGVRHQNVPLADGSVVVTHAILPAHFALLDMDKVAALVAERGGATSHGAIFARTLEIPTVTGVPEVLAVARPGEVAIVDGASGRVHLSPDEALIREYRRARQRYEVVIEHLDALRERPAETRDGRRIALTANLGLVADVRLARRHGAEGVGLFRTELLALAHRGIPSEEDQLKVYERLASSLAPLPVTIRTFDLGGDKTVAGLGFVEEENPQLGWRSIRVALTHDEGFRSQVRAILRASARGRVRLMLPMISSADELREARALIDEERKRLELEGVPFDPEMPVGVMIEVPSAALTAEALAAECDFFSIGTNDLTQYTLAVDRGNERVAHLYEPLHPGVLHLIHRAVRAADRAGIPVSVCGETASDPLAVPILVGLGITELSGTPGAIPVVKEIVRALEAAVAEERAREALAASSALAVRELAAQCLRESGLLDHPDLGTWLRGIVERHEQRAAGVPGPSAGAL